MWNDRHVEASPFMQAYERLLRDHGTDYAQVHERRQGESEIGEFYGAAGFGRRILENRQVFDRSALRSRLRSSSYVPASRGPGHAELMRELDRLFDRFQRHGRVSFEYRTRVYFGRPARAGAAS